MVSNCSLYLFILYCVYITVFIFFKYVLQGKKTFHLVLKLNLPMYLDMQTTLVSSVYRIVFQSFYTWVSKKVFIIMNGEL